MRHGDFSSVSTPLIDPLTGQPFPGNQIPAGPSQPAGAGPAAVLPRSDAAGHDAQLSPRDDELLDGRTQVQVRLQHNFTGQQAGGRGGQQAVTRVAAGRGGQQGNAGGGGRGRGAANTRTNVNMNLNFQYSAVGQRSAERVHHAGRRTRDAATTVFRPISTFSAAATSSRCRPTTTIRRPDRSTTSAASTTSSNEIGIQGVSDSSFAWGLPRLSFSSITGLSDVNPSRSVGDRVGTNVTWSRPFGRHQIQSGGTFNYDKTTTNNESNAERRSSCSPGSTPANGGALGGLTGFDFADFLLGMPQQATIAYGPGETTLTGRDLGFFFQDEWRARGNLTLNLGVRWDLRYPFVEEHGHLVNLDVTSDFTAAAPVDVRRRGSVQRVVPASADRKGHQQRLAAALGGMARSGATSSTAAAGRFSTTTAPTRGSRGVSRNSRRLRPPARTSAG